MATIFGICIKLDEMSATVVGPGTWNAAAGTYTVTLPGRGTCGGSGTANVGQLHLVSKACGTLRFTVSAIGYKYSTLAASALVYTLGSVPVSLASPGGGSFSDHCATGTMTGTGTATLQVNCGTDIWLQLAREDQTNQGSINATFTVEVVPP
jgi:hypothetical protein